MRTVKYLLLAALTFSLVGITLAEEKKDDKPVTIKKIMQTAHSAPKGEDKMCQKFAAGKLSEDETKKIIALYEDLGKNTPPKGDADAWKKKTAAVVSAAKDLAAKKEGAAEAYKKAINCGACHGEFKGK